MRMKRLEAAEAVDHGGLFEVGRDAGDEAAQHPDRERHDRGDVDDAHADDGVEQVHRSTIILYCAMNRPSAGSIWMSSTASTKVVRPRKRKRLIATAARNAKRMQKNTTVSGDREAHAERREERAVGERAGEVARRAARSGRTCGVNAVERRGREERRVDHPVDREDPDDGDDDREDAEQRSGGCGGASCCVLLEEAADVEPAERDGDREHEDRDGGGHAEVLRARCRACRCRCRAGRSRPTWSRRPAAA